MSAVCPKCLVSVGFCICGATHTTRGRCKGCGSPDPLFHGPVSDAAFGPCNNDFHRASPLPAAPETPKCPDCGKPSGGPGDVHTCTPPLAGLDFEKAMKDAREYKGMGFGVANTYEAFLNAQLRAAVQRAVAEAVQAWQAEWSIFLATCDPERLADVAGPDQRRGMLLTLQVIREAHGRDKTRDPNAPYQRYLAIAAENDTLKAERAKHAALVKTVREWQEAQSGYLRECTNDESDAAYARFYEADNRLERAEVALTSLDLGPEGANG